MASYHFCFLILLSGIYGENRDSKNNEVELRISQGHFTLIDRYTSLVQVEMYKGQKYGWRQNCAGNIINENYVLSAAHCFTIYETFKRRIRAGTTIRGYGGVVVNVSNAIIHPDFGKLDYDSDISIVVLSSPLKYTSTIKPALIALQGSVIPDDAEVWAAGWGRISPEGMSPEFLQEIQIYTINNDECAKRSQNFVKKLAVTKKMICAGLLDVGGRDVCPGDSGGGLFYEGILIGVISWDYVCSIPYFPGVYTNVGSFRDWIDSVVDRS